ncbi:MAG TPA: rRNA maturation RNase YbeY [Burkholderiales bacterium]|nr:rRNA maturation RNase YbeY [Burkholderiales bacterium]
MHMSGTSSANSRRPRSPRLSLVVQRAVATAGLPSPRKLRKWALAALAEDVRVTVRLVGEAEARALNFAYRGRDHATNVLTFPYADIIPLSGDIVICVPVLRREARAQGKTVEAHLAHLLVHGMLHLQGFDHERARDAELMEGIEAEIVTKLGYADPYTNGKR